MLVFLVFTYDGLWQLNLFDANWHGASRASAGSGLSRLLFDTTWASKVGPWHIRG